MNLHKLLAVLLLLFFISGNDSFGQGNLILLQKRLVFSANNNKDDMQIVDFGNIGKEAAEYEVSLINLRMTEQGGFETITVPDSGQYFADKNIRFFPRRIVIAPSGSQTMKVQLFDSEKLTPGEYRSHLYFRARNKGTTPEAGTAPKAETTSVAGTTQPNGDTSVAGTNQPNGTTPVEDKKPATDVSISIRTEFGIAIPVIIRKGESTTVVGLTNLKVLQNVENAPQVQFTIERTGNFSSYGHINVVHISADGVETSVGGVMGVAVYTPLTARQCTLNLDVAAKTDLSGGMQVSINNLLSSGSFRVEYVQPKEEGGAVLAKSEIQL